MSELRALNLYNCRYNNDNFAILESELQAIVRAAGLSVKRHRRFIDKILNQCTFHVFWYFGSNDPPMTYDSVLSAIERYNVTGIDPDTILTLAAQYIETFS